MLEKWKHVKKVTKPAFIVKTVFAILASIILGLISLTEKIGKPINEFIVNHISINQINILDFLKQKNLYAKDTTLSLPGWLDFSIVAFIIFFLALLGFFIQLLHFVWKIGEEPIKKIQEMEKHLSAAKEIADKKHKALIHQMEATRKIFSTGVKFKYELVHICYTIPYDGVDKVYYKVKVVQTDDPIRFIRHRFGVDDSTPSLDSIDRLKIEVVPTEKDREIDYLRFEDRPRVKEIGVFFFPWIIQSNNGKMGTGGYELIYEWPGLWNKLRKTGEDTGRFNLLKPADINYRIGFRWI